jgi:DNA helicase II / ATP-dependent DNA helicase PcrA
MSMREALARNPAEAAAEKVRHRIFRCIDEGRPFLVEAGAGAGKTYSLIHALNYLIEKQGRQLLRRNQRVACITYTNVATDEIRARTDRHPAIQSDTIHSFCWSAIRPFQPALRSHLPELANWPERLEEAGGLGSRLVEYNLGYPTIEEGRALLHHNDVIALTVALLQEPKFRRVIRDLYPILLIDEYQDTDSDFANALVTHFVAANISPLIGFFGDHWQKIYGHGCGKIEHPNLEIIGKESNFRSVLAIVNVLNRLRPELPQNVTNPTAPGSADVYHTNSWAGHRLTAAHTKGDLPPDVSHKYLEMLKAQLAGHGWDFSPEKTKILMLTHKVLAAEQGYRQLADVFSRNESYIQKEDTHIEFFVDVVEPVCAAYAAGKFGEMFEIAGGGRPTIVSRADKKHWKKEMDSLMTLRATGTVGAVMDHLRKSKLRLPNAVQRREERLAVPDEENKEAVERLQNLRAVPYQQVTALARFIQGHTPFETKHGVKGAQFDNVLVVIGRGWNLYDFNQMLEQIGTGVPPSKSDFFERNRNLFYVVCSRPKHRLALLFTQRLSTGALATLGKLFGLHAINSLPSLIDPSITI